MEKNQKTILILVLVAVVGFIAYKIWHKRNNKYYKYFHKELGFGTNLLDKFSFDELKTSFTYLENYPRKNIELTFENNPELYKKVNRIDAKYHIFPMLKLS